MTVVIAVVAALLMGTVLGLLGGGGSIMAVPILHYILDIPSKEAIATSLLVVGSTSLMATINHGRQGNVMWKIGLIFGVFAMGGAYLGGLVAQFIPGAVLLGLFALLMLVTAVMMLRGKKSDAPESAEEDEEKKLNIFMIGAEGLVVGAATGLVGAGGGFLVVPALVLLGGLPMRKAIGTSLFVIALKSGAGFAGYAGHVNVNWSVVLPFLGAALVGSLLGERLSRAIDASKLRTGFAYFVLVMGVGMLYGELPISLPIWAVGILAVALVGGLVAFETYRNRRLTPATGD
jgi:uncharacterized membrane protein YfcA